MSMRTATITVSTVEQKLHAALHSPKIEIVNGKTAMLRVLKEDLKLLERINNSYQYQYSLRGNEVGNRDDVIEQLKSVFGNPPDLAFRVSHSSRIYSKCSEIPEKLLGHPYSNEWIAFNEEGDTGITITIK